MGGTMKNIISVIFGVLIVASLFGVVTSSVSDMKWYETTEQIAAVTTEVGVTTATVTLEHDVFEGEAANVLSVTSSSASDTTLAVSAVSGDQVTVSGLEASATRTLTIKYKADSLAGFTGLSAVVVLIPVLVLIAFVYALVKEIL